MLRLKPQPSISAPTASATLSTAGSTGRSAVMARVVVGPRCTTLLARGHAHRAAARSASSGGEPRLLLAPPRDDLDDLALRQAARRPDRRRSPRGRVRSSRAVTLRIDSTSTVDHELDAHRAGGAGRQVVEHDLAELAVLRHVRRLALVELDRDELLVRRPWSRTAGARAPAASSCAASSTANCESPTLMPMSCGVTSSSARRRTRRRGCRAYAAAPSATTSSGFAPFDGFRPKIRSTTVLHRRPPRHAADEQDLLELGRGRGRRRRARGGTAPRADRAGPWSASSISSRVSVRS